MTTTPHDALFKATFTKLSHARGLLRTLLPEALAQQITWPTLRLESGIAVGDEDLDEQRMDLIYSARVGRRKVLLYVLCEHQSKVDPWMAFRLLSYLVAIWKRYRAAYPRARKLPAIIPIVVHHSPTGWTAPVAFEDLLNVDPALLDVLGPYLPRFRFLLDDISKQSDAVLRERRKMTPGGRVVILSLKHGRDPIALRVQILAPERRSRSARGVHTAILQYILATNPLGPATVRGLLVEQVGRKEADKMLMAADRLRLEGAAQGEAKGKRDALLLQLRHRFGRLPAATVARINKASLSELDAWFLQVLTAETLDEVLAAKVKSARAPRPR
jgi:hypothetical protein